MSCIWKIFYLKLATCSCENGKYLAIIMDDSVIIYDEVIEKETKTVTANFNEKKCNL